MSRLPGRSLRSRLIGAFALIISLTLLLVGIGFLFILRDYREQRELIRLGDLTGSVSFQVRTLEQQGGSAEEMAEFLARQADDLDVRILLASQQGLIFHDTEGSLVGQRINFAAAQRLGSLRRGRLLTVRGPQDQQILLVAGGPSPPGSSLAERFIGRPSAYVVALVSEPLTLAAVVREMAPRLLLAALLSLLASIGVAWLLAASIARPLQRMTRAAEEIARGHYDQTIPAGRRDEVGRLATAFNTMAREVARSDRALRDFLANVSHDLRTPLTSIQGFSQAMIDGSLHDREEYLDAGRIVNDEAARMRRLVEDVLELSAIEAGRGTLEAAPVDLAALVRRTVERVARRAAEGEIELAYRIEATPTVRGDSRRLERVFDNLLDNALKHTPAGGRVTVTVGHVEDTHRDPVGLGRPGANADAVRALRLKSARTGRNGRDGVERAVPDDRSCAVVAIHNTGSVIPPEDLPRIFERFYQVDKSRTGSAGGSGLGLAIAQEVVQLHGGRIWATSGDGTELTVTIPRLDPLSGSGLGSASPPAVSRARAR